MHDARVLVVDDSAAMRALFCDILDEAKNVRVVGTAKNADEAREKIEELHPNVLTLDVEMPGMSGMEFLEEIMNDRPMPVVMLSSVTQVGTGTALRALELGAVEIFPKPLHTSPEEFNVTVGKLGKIVHAAANSNVRERQAAAAGKPPTCAVADDYAWNGSIIALSGSMGGVEVLKEILAAYPANCPPTIVALPIEPGIAHAFIEKAKSSFGCKVQEAYDGAPLEQGVVYIAYNPARHAVVEKGDPSHIRLVDRDPVAGVRPSADLMFGSIARSGVPAIAAVLSGYGADGVRGLGMLRAAGYKTLVQDPERATVSETPRLALEAKASDEPLATNALHQRIMELSGT